MKKIIAWAVILLIVLVGFLWLQNRQGSPPIQHQGVVVNNWNSALGAAEENSKNLERQKLSFWATVWNDSTEPSFVANVKMKMPDSLRTHILSGETVFFVNQSLEPNATYEVKGELILDTQGMTKQDIINLGKIEGFTVETRQK